MAANQRDNFLVVEALGVKHVANVISALSCIRQAAIWWAAI
jgi:hypothetical protein